MTAAWSASATRGTERPGNGSRWTAEHPGDTHAAVPGTVRAAAQSAERAAADLGAQLGHLNDALTILAPQRPAQRRFVPTLS